MSFWLLFGQPGHTLSPSLSDSRCTPSRVPRHSYLYKEGLPKKEFRLRKVFFPFKKQSKKQTPYAHAFSEPLLSLRVRRFRKRKRACLYRVLNCSFQFWSMMRALILREDWDQVLSLLMQIATPALPDPVVFKWTQISEMMCVSTFILCFYQSPTSVEYLLTNSSSISHAFKCSSRTRRPQPMNNLHPKQETCPVPPTSVNCSVPCLSEQCDSDQAKSLLGRKTALKAWVKLCLGFLSYKRLDQSKGGAGCDFEKERCFENRLDRLQASYEVETRVHRNRRQRVDVKVGGRCPDRGWPQVELENTDTVMASSCARQLGWRLMLFSKTVLLNVIKLPAGL